MEIISEITEWVSALEIIAGTSLNIEQMQTLVSVKVTQRVSCPTHCELVFVVTGGISFELLNGDPLVVRVSQSSAMLFNGTVRSIEYQKDTENNVYLFIRGYDLLINMRNSFHVESYEKLSLPELIGTFDTHFKGKIEYHCKVPELRYVMQYNENDLQCIARLAQNAGVYLYYDKNKLHLFNLDEGVKRAVSISDPSDIYEMSIEQNDTVFDRAVCGISWDPSMAKVYDVMKGNAVRNEYENKKYYGKVSGSESEIESCVNSTRQRLNAAKLVYRGTVKGNVELSPGVLFQSSALDGKCGVKSVITYTRHSISADGSFRTEFSTEVPEKITPPSFTSILPGVICAIDDPIHRGRVRVQFPTLANIKSDWMNVVMPGAGAKKGLVMVPSKDDTVMVALSHEDASKGIVLGGIYTKDQKPESFGVNEKQTESYLLHTRGGQSLSLSDDGNTIRLKTDNGCSICMCQEKKITRIENSDGSFVEMNQNQTIVHSVGDLILEAPGKSVEIRGGTINFTQK